MDKVAVIILNWNGAKMMQRFLPNIIKYTRGTIYVADNASTDDSLNILAKDFPKVKTILLDKNYGFAEGYNKALAKINAEYFVLLNSDVEVKDDWLTPLIDFMDRHPKIAACQPKILSQSHPDTFEYAGASGGFLDSLGYPYCRGRIFDTLEQDNGQYNTSLPIFWATGAAMTVRSAVYLEVGGLDGRFFAHMEEIDFCWRLRSRGYGIVCLPTSTVYHVGGGTLPQNNPQKTFLNFRNNLFMLYKNLPDDKLRQVLFCRFWLDMLAALQFLLKGNYGDFKAVLKAHQAFSKQRTLFTRSRFENKQKTILTSIPEQFPKSILWEYYLGRRRTFNVIQHK